MKYIRTKEHGVCKVTDEDDYLIHYHNSQIDGVLWKEDWKGRYKAADTIEELIDEYVAKKDCSRPFVIKKYEIYSNLQFGFTIYGSIWVDDNLVKVAKMNEKGELELL